MNAAYKIMLVFSDNKFLLQIIFAGCRHYAIKRKNNKLQSHFQHGFSTRFFNLLLYTY